MNFKLRLIEKIKQKNSVVCAGFDIDIESNEFPAHILNNKNPKLEFAKIILDEISEIIPIIKLNTRFYLANEIDQLKSIINYAHKKDLEVIGDCKENDIGNSMAMAYRKQFGDFNFDAITVNAYFGSEGVIGTEEMPIFKKWFDKGKGLFVIIRSSNFSSEEIQDLRIQEKNDKLPDSVPNIFCYHLANLVENWSSKYNFTIGGVVGATKPDQLKIIRQIISGILLIPGFGAQGGKLEDLKYAFSKNKYSIINSSRSLMYAYNRSYKGKFELENFAKASKMYVENLNSILKKYIK